jgi:hypothetical protein
MNVLTNVHDSQTLIFSPRLRESLIYFRGKMKMLLQWYVGFYTTRNFIPR